VGILTKCEINPWARGGNYINPPQMLELFGATACPWDHGWSYL